jgi:hypothetical protein
MHHDRNADRITNAEKILKNFAFGKLPVRHRQDHHRIGRRRVVRTAHAGSSLLLSHRKHHPRREFDARYAPGMKEG